MIIQNHRRVETSAKLKKMYSAFANAIKLAEVEQGIPINNWSFDGYHDLIDNYLGKYLNYIKIEDHDDCMPGCTNIYLQDGTIVGFDCDTNLLTPDKEICVEFDINGDKGPNEFHRDIFQFGIYGEYYSGKYNLPSFSQDDVNTCRREKGKEKCSREDLLDLCKQNWLGACSALIMTDGWEIKDDYPYRL